MVFTVFFSFKALGHSCSLKVLDRYEKCLLVSYSVKRNSISTPPTERERERERQTDRERETEGEK